MVTDIKTAFEILLDELGAEIIARQEEGGDDATSRPIATQRKRKKQLDELVKARKQIVAIEKQCIDALRESTKTDASANEVAQSAPHNPGLQRRTPESSFYLPILEALDHLGGSASPREVIERLAITIGSRLSEIDRQRLASGRREERWQNTVRWARATMTADKRLAKSAHGVWVISERGRAWIRKRQNQLTLFDNQ